MSIPILTEKDFDYLRNSARVKKHLRLITPDHTGGIGCYLLGLPLWLFAAVYGGYALDRAGLYPGRWVFYALLAFAVLLPLLPIVTARRHMRRPVLDALATLTGMDYASHDFELKGYEAAKPLLFGEEAIEVFTDLLAGKEGSNSFAICHAEIEAGGEPLHSGLLYWFGRRGRSSALLSVVPAAARVKTSGKTKRLEGLGDDTFDAAFAVFSNQSDVARELLSRNFRELLLGYAAQGPVYFYLGQNNAFLAGAGPAAFETPAEGVHGREARLRAIFDNVAAALDVARKVRAKLDAL